MMAAERCLNNRRVPTVRTLFITVFCRTFSFPTTARAGTLLPAVPISREMKNNNVFTGPTDYEELQWLC